MVEKWVQPVRGRYTITDNFADHKARGSVNPGLDYAVNANRIVRAISAGTVKVADGNPDGAGGRMVVIDHGGTVVSESLHLSAVKVTAGQEVKAGDMIGYAGGSGFGKEQHYGTHLHLAIKVGGKNYDPAVFLGKRV